MSLSQEIETVLALCGKIDDSPHRYMLIKDGMGFASRNYIGQRNLLIIDKQDGQSIVLTGNMLKKFNIEMSVFGWDENGNIRNPDHGITFKGTAEEADIVQNEIIERYFNAIIQEEDEIRTMQGKPTIKEEQIAKTNLQQRNALLQSQMTEIDEKIKKLDDELNSGLEESINAGNVKVTWQKHQQMVKAIHDLCDEHDVLRWEFEKNERELYYL